jgi:hypothetical protein
VQQVQYSDLKWDREHEGEYQLLVLALTKVLVPRMVLVKLELLGQHSQVD